MSRDAAFAEEYGGGGPPSGPEPIYGHYPGGDPRWFVPDQDCCTPEELAAHKAACEKRDREEAEGVSHLPEQDPSGFRKAREVFPEALIEEMGIDPDEMVHVTSGGGFGIGTYWVDPANGYRPCPPPKRS